MVRPLSMSPALNPHLSFLFGRRSVRAYQQKPVSDDMVADLLSAAMAAPSACGKDPWRFVVARQKPTLQALATALPNGSMSAGAPLGIVVGGDLDAAHANELSYLLQDCAAAIENLLLAAPALGLGACWLGIHPRPPRIEAVSKILGLPANIVPVSGIAIGWPAEEKVARTRFDAKYVHKETW